MKRIVSNVVVAAVAGVLVGNGWAAEQSAAQEAMESLKAESRQARFSMAGSRVARVYGQPLSFGTTPQDAAESFKARHAAVFGVEPEDLEQAGLSRAGPLIQPVMLNPDSGLYKFMLARYAHHKNGIPVFRSDLRLLMRNEVDYPLVLATSSLRSLGDFNPDPAAKRSGVDPAQIDAGMQRFSRPETVIWAGIDDMQSEPKLAYTFIGEKGSPSAGEYEKWLYVVDANSGDVLYKENRIIFTDVIGNVSGMATEGPKADYCAPEVSTLMPWATVSIQGGNSVYTDVNGDFTIPNAGTSDVTVQSPTSGHYFAVTDYAGPEELLMQVVTPPGPADFMHNADNTIEFVRAQVNAYVEANVVRDFALTYNPDYPVISTETDFPVRVNRIDKHCPGNAWYDYESINFCRAASGFPNTAFSVVVQHEYGHHMVETGGSGQGQYGEGMSDTVGVLIEDEPVLAYGWYGDCNTGLRTADNDFQYPCDGGIHYCGQLLSGCVWSTRNELVVTEPGAYLDILSNLTVNSILLHTGSAITPVVTIDFLVLDDDDGDLGNGSPHWNEICAGFGAHSMNCPDLIPCSVPSDCPDDDGLFCNGPDCVHGLCYYVEDPCDDGEVCTQDICDEANDTCSNPPLECPPPPDPCDMSFCHPILGCVYVTDGNPCNDGLFCNGFEGCSGGDCYPGFPPCPEGCCDEANNMCLTCDDDGVCESDEDCHCCPNDCIGSGVTCGNNICESADGEDCVSCPDDCNGKVGGKPSDRYCCGDGTEQYGVTCADPRCTGDGNTCTSDPAAAYCCGDGVCEDIEDETNCAIDCVPPCTSDPDCDDGDACTTDICDPQVGCVYTPMNCDDGDACTADGCSNGECFHDPITCDDGDLCTTDSCDWIVGCVYTPIDCSDGDACTTDDCSGGLCVNDPITCDDGDVCTTDSCEPASGCVYTPIPGCTPCAPKGDPCSIDDDCCSKKCRAGKCR